MLLPPPHNFILFELDFDVKFPLLRLLLFLSALKSTIVLQKNDFGLRNTTNCPFKLSNVQEELFKYFYVLNNSISGLSYTGSQMLYIQKSEP